MSIGSRMRERRESLGLTQIQLADLLGVTKGAIGNYETDANSPKASILYKIFEVLQCDANYLFQDEIRERRETTATPSEMEGLVKKYRFLDLYGKEAVDDVLDVEWRRCMAYEEEARRTEQAKGITKLYVAARDGSRMEVEVGGEITLPDEDADIPE